MTFNDLCADLRVTHTERAKLVEFLAIFRAIRTIRALANTNPTGAEDA